MSRNIVLSIFICLLILTTGTVQGGTLYVPEQYPLIQTAIDSASYGDIVNVGPGTYSPSTNGESFPIVMKNGVTLMSRDEAISTIIDAEQTNTVLQCISLDKNTTIRGFTIRHGSAFNAGGLYCENSSMIIEDNIISENDATGGQTGKGGGLYILSCDSIQVRNNSISGNYVYGYHYSENDARAYAYGGGIYCESSHPIIADNSITGNSSYAYSSYGGYVGSAYSYSYGAGIYCKTSSPQLGNNVIMTNSTSAYGRSGDTALGGGFYCTSATEAMIHGNLIQSNTATDEGGGIYVHTSGGLRSPFEIVQNKISGNSSDVGAGIRCVDASPTIIDNLISENTSNNYGGGISCYQSGSDIKENTIIDNTSEMGGGIHCEQSTGMPEISDNMIVDNDGSEGAGIYLTSSSPLMQTNTWYQNFAVQEGGAVWTSSSEPWIIENKIISNMSPTGGAFYTTGSQLPTIGCGGDDLRNDIYSNGTNSVYNASSSNLPMEYNWWGSSPPDTSRFYGPIDCEPWSETPGYPICVLLLPENTSLSEGDDLVYEVKLLNESNSPQTFDAWTEVTLPNGYVYPLLGPVRVTTPPGYEFIKSYTNSIPPFAPSGLYLFTAKIGTYPDQVTDYAMFHFYIE